MPFLAAWRYLCNSPLINLSYTRYGSLLFLRCRSLIPKILQGTLLQPRIVEPNVVIAAVVR